MPIDQPTEEAGAAAPGSAQPQTTGTQIAAAQTTAPQTPNVQATGDFADVLAANADYVTRFDLAGLRGNAAAGLAVVTCMDSRIAPLAMLGLQPGDAKILRNAGARVTDDVLRTLVLATHLLGVNRVLVVIHTDCKMSSTTDDEIDRVILEHSGTDTRSLDFGVVIDQEAVLRHDVERIQAWPFLPRDIIVGGFRYDVSTGRLKQIC